MNKYMTSPYCSGPMKYETAVIPAKVTEGNAEHGIQYWRGLTSWTPAFALRFTHISSTGCRKVL